MSLKGVLVGIECRPRVNRRVLKNTPLTPEWRSHVSAVRRTSVRINLRNFFRFNEFYRLECLLPKRREKNNTSSPLDSKSKKQKPFAMDANRVFLIIPSSPLVVCVRYCTKYVYRSSPVFYGPGSRDFWIF